MSIDSLLSLAAEEDIGGGDITSRATIPEHQRSVGIILAKAEGVLCGTEVATEVFQKLGGPVDLQWVERDAAPLRLGTRIVHLSGFTRDILTAERIALNFLQRLSGVATLTRKYVDAVTGTGAQILDTRKTTPGYRMLDKYAVRCGGGTNHRIGLFDMFLIKENHILAAGGVAPAIERCLSSNRVFAKPLKIEVETRTLDDVRACMPYPIARVMLDNMPLAMMAEAVQIVDKRFEIEASGGVNLQTVRSIAETGVDYISVGAITHSAPALDLSLLLTENL